MVDPQSAPQIQEIGLCSLNQISLQPCRVKLGVMLLAFFLALPGPVSCIPLTSQVAFCMVRGQKTHCLPSGGQSQKRPFYSLSPMQTGWFAQASVEAGQGLLECNHISPPFPWPPSSSLQDTAISAKQPLALVSLPPARHSPPHSSRSTPRTALLRVLQWWASLGVHWPRNCLPIQEIRVQFLIQENPTHHGGTNNCTTQLLSLCSGTWGAQLLKPMCLDPRLQSKKATRNEKSSRCKQRVAPVCPNQRKACKATKTSTANKINK